MLRISFPKKLKTSCSRSIIFIIGSVNTGGTETHLLGLFIYLISKGYSIKLLLLKPEGALLSNFQSLPISIHCVPNITSRLFPGYLRKISFFLSLVIFLCFFVVLNHHSIFHFFLPASYLLVAPFTVLAGVKYRIMSRRSLNLYQSKLLFSRKAEYLLHLFMHRVIANSLSVKQDLLSEGIPSSRISLIYNGVDTDKFKFNLQDRIIFRRNNHIDPDSFVCVCVANLKTYKGHDVLINSFGILASEGITPPHLLFAGRDDGILSDLLSLAKSNSVLDYIHFLGPISEVSTVLSASDLYISASREEGFSNSILEAMSIGLPILATDVGGNPEAVLHFHNGIIIDPNSPSQTANAIQYISTHPNSCSLMSSNSRHRALNHFSLDSCHQQYQSLYSSLR